MELWNRNMSGIRSWKSCNGVQCNKADGVNASPIPQPKRPPSNRMITIHKTRQCKVIKQIIRLDETYDFIYFGKILLNTINVLVEHVVNSRRWLVNCCQNCSP